MSVNHKDRRSSAGLTYANTYINLFRFNPTTKQNDPQGQFIFTITETSDGLVLMIYKQGNPPIISFSVTKSLRWLYQNGIYCYFDDPRRVQWLIQFNTTVEAAHVTATITTYLNYTPSQDLHHFDITKSDSKGVNTGDTVQLSYYVFPMIEFPRCDRCVASIETQRIKLNSEKLIVALSKGLVGMSQGTRVIFAPKEFSSYENGTRDSKIPNSQIVVVATVHRIKYSDQPDQGDVDTSPSDTHTMPSAPEKTDQSDACETENSDTGKISRIRRMQAQMGVATPFATPFTGQISDSGVDGTPNSARLDQMEQSINKKLDDIGSGSDDIVLSVLTLAAQLHSRQEEAAELKRKLEMTRSKSTVSARAVEQKVTELDGLKKKEAQTERKLRDAKARLEEAGGEDEADIAVKKTTTLIKKLMDGVFEDIGFQLDPAGNYTGEDISDRLYQLFRQHSLPVLDEIKENGVLN